MDHLTLALHKYQGMPSAYVRRFYHRELSPSSAVVLLRRVEGHRPAFGRNQEYV